MAVFTLTLIFSSLFSLPIPWGSVENTQRKLKHVPFNTNIPHPHGLLPVLKNI